MSDVTHILDAIQQGDAKAADELLPLVYQELRRLAAFKMASQVPGHTLQPTALVHEAWLRLAVKQDHLWNGRTHFFAAAAEAMRRILIDSARRKQALRHGGGHPGRVDIAAMDLPSPLPDDQLLALDSALNRLTEFNSRAADVVKLCFFVGFTQDQAAQELGVSLSTVERLWSFARTFLYSEIERERNPERPEEP